MVLALLAEPQFRSFPFSCTSSSNFCFFLPEENEQLSLFFQFFRYHDQLSDSCWWKKRSTNKRTSTRVLFLTHAHSIHSI